MYNFPPTTLSPKANESVTLSCFVSGGISVIWWRNGQKITTATESEYSGGTVSKPSLTITKVTRYHSGNYTCGTSYGSVTATSDSPLRLSVQGTEMVLCSILIDKNGERYQSDIQTINK